MTPPPDPALRPPAPPSPDPDGGIGRARPAGAATRRAGRRCALPRAAGAALAVALAAGPVAAHPADGGTAADVSIALALVAVAAVYLVGLLRLWRRAGPARGVGTARPLLFTAGLALVGVLLLSPLDGLAERGLSAHMVQHFGLMLVAAPLIVLGRPGLVALWALPGRARPAAARLGSGGTGRAWRALTHPIGAWLVYLVALWVWHAPPLHQAALADAGVHAAQHASFLAAALIFWTAVLEPARMERRAGAFLAIFATAVHSCALAALITTAGTVWYPAYGPSPFGLTPLADQQLGGLVMWAPCCALLIGSALAVFARLLRDVEARAQRTAP